MSTLRTYPTGIHDNPAIDAWLAFDPLQFEDNEAEETINEAEETIAAIAAAFEPLMKGRITLTLLAKLDEVLGLPGEPLGGIPDSWTYAYAGTRTEVVEALIGDATVNDDGEYRWEVPTLSLEEIPGKRRRRRYRRSLRGVLRKTGRYQIHQLRKMSTEALIRGIRKHRERFGL